MSEGQALAASGTPVPVELGTDSGLYTTPKGPLLVASRSLRLDVDGRYPQMTASGTRSSSLVSGVFAWIASLEAASGGHHWTGSVWYTNGDIATFPYTTVDIQVARNSFGPVSATVTFAGGGFPNKIETYIFNSKYFRTMEFEFDAAEGTKAVSAMFTSAHPDRPSTLPDEILNLKLVYQRAGFDVKKSGGDDVVPLDMANADELWNELELHDAMQVYWSQFAPKAQSSVWVFFASLSKIPPYTPSQLGGIMFDDIGPNHRQGCAIFEDSFISEAPPGDSSPDAWVRRMRFWTAAHEMGHTFNLAHSWQKTGPWGPPWTPLIDEPDALSFLNYPSYYPIGEYQTDEQVIEFFQSFEYRFSDGELLFMRHAPSTFVQQGNADWFDQHGVEGANLRAWSPYRLQVRVNREPAVYHFMEPAIVELKLTNASSQPVLVPSLALTLQDRIVAVIKKRGSPARRFVPYAQYCVREGNTVLGAGESMYGSLFLGAGRNGWDLAEPGSYTIQVGLHLNGEDVLSNPLRVRVAPPRGVEEETLAQEFFSDEVGRILAFGGSLVLSGGNAVLREVAERFPDSRAALHARIALGNAAASRRKRLRLEGPGGPAVPAHAAGGRIVTVPADEHEARRDLSTALGDQSIVAAETLGHIRYKERAIAFAHLLVETGDVEGAAQLLSTVRETLTQRGVPHRFLEDIEARRDF